MSCVCTVRCSDGDVAHVPLESLATPTVGALRRRVSANIGIAVSTLYRAENEEPLGDEHELAVAVGGHDFVAGEAATSPTVFCAAQFLGRECTDNDIESLCSSERAVRFRALDLSACAELTFKSFDHIKTLNNLRELSLRGCAHTVDPVNGVRTLLANDVPLTALDLSNMLLDAGYAHDLADLLRDDSRWA